MARDAILKAVVTLISTRGPEETTVRNVAAEAGVSVGAVQHHYRTKDELLSAAMDAMNAMFTEIVTQVLGDIPDPRARLRAFLLMIAAAGDQSRDGAVIWTVFAARAAVNQRLRQQHSDNWKAAEKALLGLMREAYPDRKVTPDDAALLLAVADGIAVARAAETPERISEMRAVKIIDNALRQWDVAG